jgi:hypothetical protein
MAVASVESSSLHRQVLVESGSFLRELPVQTAKERAIVAKGGEFLLNKSLCKEVSLPSASQPEEQRLFNDLVYRAIREAITAMIDQRRSTQSGKSEALQGMSQQQESKTEIDTVMAGMLKRVVSEREEQVAALGREIALLTAWSRAPFRVFTDPLAPFSGA